MCHAKYTIYVEILHHVHTRLNLQGGDILHTYIYIHTYTIYNYSHFDFYICVSLFQLNNGSNSVLSCELDTLCELWHFDVYKFDLLNNHVEIVPVLQCFDHKGFQFGMFTVA